MTKTEKPTSGRTEFLSGRDLTSWDGNRLDLEWQRLFAAIYRILFLLLMGVLCAVVLV